MIVSPKYEFIFCHIPKTAGSSVASALRGFGFTCATWQVKDYQRPGSNNQHVRMRDLRQSNLISREQFSNYFKFCFVRNPWDRMVSMYHFRQSEHYQRNHHNAWEFAVKNEFDDWLRAILPTKSYIQALPTILDDDGSVLVDKIYRFENVREDFDRMKAHVNLPVSTDDRLLGDTRLHKVNATKHKHYTEYYSNESKDLIVEYMKDEIEMFGYEFGR